MKGRCGDYQVPRTPSVGVTANMGGDDMGGDLEGELDEIGLMEYTVKVPAPKHGDNGTNTKSTIDNMKNDMGGTAKNIAQSFSTTTGGTDGGLAKNKPVPNPDAAGNLNVPGGTAGKKAFTKKEPGHGAEKKGAGEGKLAGADGSVAINSKSEIGGKVR